MRRLAATWWIGLLALCLAACLDDRAGVDGDVGAQADAADTWTLSDGGANAGDGIATWDVDTGVPDPGTFGASCTFDEDCYSSWCMPSPKGMVCSKTCQETCPHGWDCESVTAPNGSPALVCVHPRAFVCLPCQAHKDCNQVFSGEANLCLSQGEAGSFCALACDDDHPCKDGQVCEPVDAPTGDVVGQCVPADGVCACNGLGVELQPKTDCVVSNLIGACEGTRTCADDGLTECNATPPEDETCDGQDNDCDGATDEFTGGNYCENTSEIGMCPGIDLCVDGVLECQGDQPQDESCNGDDDDCDGTTDEGFPDLDEDGIADCVDTDSDGDGTLDDADCAPFDPAIHPGAQEICNLVDDDCDDKVDEADAGGCQAYYLDLDEDGYGDVNMPPACLCDPNPITYYTATEGGDCNDWLPTTHPNADEPCNGIDDDCDGTVDDEDFDADGDGIADCLDTDDDNDGFLDGVDCAPIDPSIFPGAPESCNGEDNDCNGLVNEEGADGCKYYLRDVDGDGQGSLTDPPRCLCEPDPENSYTATLAGDCDDLDAEIYAGATEICNGKNDDCDKWVDESYLDSDGDGQADCIDEDDDNDGALDDEDCAPLDKDVFPDQPESCNGSDDNCDGLIDDVNAVGCTVYWRDVDEDGFGSNDHPTLCLCEADPVIAYTSQVGGDCNDLASAQFPGATEICNNKDDNCDGQYDEGVTSPCGNCFSLCVVEIGPDGTEGFNSGFGSSQGVNSDANGHLVLGTMPGSGFHRHILEGWPSANTLWDFLSLQVEFTGSGAWITIRYRAGDDLDDLLNASWSNVNGPFPPQNFPLDIDLVADFLEVEITLNSAASGDTPILKAVSVIAYEQ